MDLDAVLQVTVFGLGVGAWAALAVLLAKVGLSLPPGAGGDGGRWQEAGPVSRPLISEPRYGPLRAH
jgi:hypothetical protein